MSTSCPTAPSSASVCGIFNHDKGAWPKFFLHWGLRGLLVLPGFAVAGVRGSKLVVGPLFSSTMISLFLVGYTAIQKSRQGRKRLAGHPRLQRRLAERHEQHRTNQRALAARRRYHAKKAHALAAVKLQHRVRGALAARASA